MTASPFHFRTFALRKIDEKVILIFHMMKISIKSGSLSPQISVENRPQISSNITTSIPLHIAICAILMML